MEASLMVLFIGDPSDKATEPEPDLTPPSYR